jgi:D-aminoacyl-tRNA deacylase
VRAILQRVSRAEVRVDGEVVGSIGRGLLVLLGVAKDDPPQAEEVLARKTAGLRIFPDDDGKMNRSLIDVGGDALVVSQFTLLADARKGRRPSFLEAAPPADADRRYQAFCERLRTEGVGRVQTGRFQAQMDVELVNDGPVTIALDTDQLITR